MWLNKAGEPTETCILSHFTEILISIWCLMVQYEGIMEFKQPGNLSLLIRDQNCEICNYLHTCPRILAVSSQQHEISFPVLQDWASEERDQSPETLTQSLELWHVSPCRTSRGPLKKRYARQIKCAVILSSPKGKGGGELGATGMASGAQHRSYPT